MARMPDTVDIKVRASLFHDVPAVPAFVEGPLVFARQGDESWACGHKIPYSIEDVRDVPDPDWTFELFDQGSGNLIADFEDMDSAIAAREELLRLNPDMDMLITLVEDTQPPLT